MSYGYTETLGNEARHRYTTKMALVGLSDCPYRLPGDFWVDDPTRWPDLQYPDLFNYLVNSPGVYTSQNMKSNKSLDAHIYFRSGWVQTVYHMKTDCGNHILRGGVRPSQRVTDKMHNPWVAICDDGTVMAAHCDCMAGLGESCSHVGALLFKIEAAVRNGYTKQACTDLPCSWNACFVKDIKPAPVADIQFYRDEARSKADSCPRKRRKTADLRPVDEDTTQKFVQLMCTEEDTLPIMLHTYSDTCQNFKSSVAAPQPTLPQPLRDFYDEENANLPSNELSAMCDSLQQDLHVTLEQINHLQKITTQQSQTLVWYRHRAGRITSSTAYDVLHTDPEHPSHSLIRKITSDSDIPLPVPAAQYGRKFEKVTFEELQATLPHIHQNVEITAVGMRISQDKPWLAASADGIVKCTCHGEGVLEIKCPYTFRNSSVSDMLSNQTSSCLDPSGKIKNTHRYFAQIQLQMFVYNVEYCLFVVRASGEICINMVKQDQGFIDNMTGKFDRFWVKHIAPELLTRKMECTKAALDEKAPSHQDRQLYCYCQVPADPDNEDPHMVLVGCDGAACPYQWVHLGCIRPRRKTVPKGKWYCKKCKNSAQL